LAREKLSLGSIFASISLFLLDLLSPFQPCKCPLPQLDLSNISQALLVESCLPVRAAPSRISDSTVIAYALAWFLGGLSSSYIKQITISRNDIFRFNLLRLNNTTDLSKFIRLWILAYRFFSLPAIVILNISIWICLRIWVIYFGG